MSDSELVEKILSHNSQKAFEELVNKYQPLVIKTCIGFVSSYADAEDLAQEVFIEVYESLQKYRGEAKISTWIYRIAVNKSLNQVRKYKRNQIFRSIDNFFTIKDGKREPLEIIDTQGIKADGKIERSENKKMLKNALNTLPENQRIAFILSKYQDLSYKEIADIMDISLSSVESLLFRAKSNLQKYLKVEMMK